MLDCERLLWSLLARYGVACSPDYLYGERGRAMLFGLRK
jgi:hypothetical protein